MNMEYAIEEEGEVHSAEEDEEADEIQEEDGLELGEHLRMYTLLRNKRFE